MTDADKSDLTPSKPDSPENAPRQRFMAEMRDAVTVKSFLLVVGVLLLQFGFIASYLGAFHDPKPRRIPIAVVAPAGAPSSVAAGAASQLNGLPGTPLKARVAPDEATARAQIKNRTVYGAILLGPSGGDRLLVASAAGASVSAALEAIVQAVDRSQNRTVTVMDVLPSRRGDARGLSAFYLVVGWVVGGYLVAAILGIAGGARPANRNRALIRLGSLALYAIVSGLGGAVLAETILSALSGHFVTLWFFGALIVFAVSAFTMAAQTVLGILGIGVAILLFVILGNPSAGGAYPSVLLPPFWAAIGPWLPPGAGVDAVRTIVYFPAASLARDIWTLVGYAAVGVAVTVVAAAMRLDRKRAQGAE